MNRLSQSAIMEESEVREAKKWRRANALWFPATGSYHTQNSGRVNKRNINWGGAGWGNTRTRPGFFKQFPNPSQTHLLKFNPVPLGAGRVPEKTRPIAIPNFYAYWKTFAIIIFYFRINGFFIFKKYNMWILL